MAPHLSPEVIAAIETAVECNGGSLESAFIHSLAKIYKTSPQAVVWNMKRYNKVKAGCDDRQKTGRRATMDKDEAAIAIKEFLAETPGEKMESLCNKLYKRFEVRVSTTWVSRVIRAHNIEYKVPKGPKPPRIPRERILKSPKPPQGEVNLAQYPPDVQFGQQYQLPQPDQYPSFRHDLQQAISLPPTEQHNSVGRDSGRESVPVLFGMMEPQSPQRAQYSSALQYQYQPLSTPTYPNHVNFSPTSSSSSSTPIDPAISAHDSMPSHQARPRSSTGAANDHGWKVLKVVELP